jgi:hypothetical protein
MAGFTEVRNPLIPVTQKLLDEASTRKLSAKERRQCVVYLKTTNPDVTNVSMAELFQVTERTIRQDLQAFRREKARFIKEDDVGLIIADIALDYERQIRDIERGKAKATVGSKTFLDYCTAAMELRLKCVKALQDLGYYPKNLGNMTIKKFDFKAIVNKMDGSVTTVRAEKLSDQEDVIDAEFDVKELTDGSEESA